MVDEVPVFCSHQTDTPITQMRKIKVIRAQGAIIEIFFHFDKLLYETTGAVHHPGSYPNLWNPRRPDRVVEDVIPFIHYAECPDDIKTVIDCEISGKLPFTVIDQHF